MEVEKGPAQLPTLQHALAVALLLRCRVSAAVAEAQERCSRLERETEALRSGAVVPPPLVQLLAPPVGAAQPGHPGATQASWAATPADASPSKDAALRASRQHEALALWHAAAAALPPPLQPTLAQAQRYLLLAELQRGGAPDMLPLIALLDRTPVRALLELATDILQAHAAPPGGGLEVGAGGGELVSATAPAANSAVVPAAAAAVAAPAAASGAASVASRSATHASPALQRRPVQLAPAHGALLASAAACIALLCDRPGQTAAQADFESLQLIGPWLLQLAATPSPSTTAAADQQQQQQPASAGSGAAPSQAAPMPNTAPVPGGAIDLRQPTSGVAQAVLAALHQSGTAGITLLSCCAPTIRNCMLELVEAVLGEQPMLVAPGDGGAAAAAATAEEARLLHRLLHLSSQLSAGLRLLPQWAQALSFFDEAFMHGVADAILSARDASQLIAVTHPEAARQMQRCAAQMVAALQQIQAAGDS